ncbi:MAG: hypothetical protein V3U67_08785 [Gemmatimonadota bacterium]
MRRFVLSVLAVTAQLAWPDAALAWPGAALACPGCIEASDPGLYTGFLWGMGLMMVAPMLLVVGIGGGILHARRRALRDAVDSFLKEETGRT